ncbi:Gastric cancer antigen Zg14 [Phytophthora palmivora]|uniref:Gastric cancer antigen Zg14 n=1 Tax=Phytophthora palmivora TaxID=4796 RepID=A0A2P4X3Q3_9STRA|nr:Gastric cancer antigen Zg14 [Phytophthora palmivora]
MSTKVFSGYHAIALPLPHSSFHRFIYAKQHDTKPSANAESILAANRTAYLVNLPANASEAWIRACLEPLGAIQHVVAGSGGLFNEEDEDEAVAMDNVANRTAHVVFKTEKSLDKMLKVDVLETPAPGKSCGLQGYAAKYRRNRPGLSVVKEMADRYMATFDEMEEQDMRRREELKNQVDDDGFQTVVNTKKRGVIQAEEVLARPAKKQKSKELDNFYRFQTREKKRDQLKTLRERFEEDRQLVEKMKKANKFKPE